MQEATLEANPDRRIQVLAIGREETPVIIIDDFASSLPDIRGPLRREAVFERPSRSVYPGVRSPLPRAHVIATLNAVHQLLYETYEIPRQLQLLPQNGVLSLVSIRPADLTIGQSMPHFDSSRPLYIAITHFLNEGPFGGTGFFRHNPTGIENIRGHRLPVYLAAGEAFVRANGRPPPGYIRSSDAHFTLYHTIEYRANRLVIYPGSLLHSGLIDPNRDIDGDPETGRLTANIFVDFQ